MKHHGETFSLANGVDIPCLGFGTWQMKEGPETVAAIQKALELGYRHIDTAAYYQNERSVGQAVRASGLPREAVFVTSKVWNTDRGYESTLRAFDRTMEKLGLDYLDLYLIHWPRPDLELEDWAKLDRETWCALERLYESGLVRAIGVSNFQPDRLVDLILHNEVVPAVNQVETHPFCQQTEAAAVMASEGVQIESWAPFAEGRNNLFGNGTLVSLAAKYRKSVAQVVLRWLIQRGVVVIPKSVRPERMAENIAVFDFHLAPEDMDLIATLDTRRSCFLSHRDPETVKWLGTMKYEMD